MERNENEIREIEEDEYSMVSEMENEALNEIMNEEEIEEENEEENIGRRILREIVCYNLERKGYESEKVRYQINNIYRKYGLKINNTKLLSLNKLRELINDMIRYNYKNEKNENLFKKIKK